MRIIRFDEVVGFDDENTRDRLEIPNLRGDLDMDSPTMKPFTKKSVDTSSIVNKIIFKYPILGEFHKNSKLIDGANLESFYATGKKDFEGVNFYAQLSIAYKDGNYHMGTIIRDRLDYENPDNWIKHFFIYDNIDDVFNLVNNFLICCEKLTVIDNGDLVKYNFLSN